MAGLKKMFSNAGFSLKLTWEQSRYGVVWGLVGILAKIAAPLAGIWLPKLVLDGVTSHAPASEFFLSVGLGALALVVLRVLNQYGGAIIEHFYGMQNSVSFAVKLAEKKLDMDYELLTDSATIKAYEKAERACTSNHALACNYPRFLAELVANIGGFLLYGALIAGVHPAMLPLIALSAIATTLMLQRATRFEQKNREKNSKLYHKVSQILKMYRDPELAKDIRLYGLAGLLFRKREKYHQAYLAEEDQVGRRNMEASLVAAAMVLLRDGVAYALLVWLLVQGRVSLGDFVMMFAAIGAFAGWLQGIILSANQLQRAGVGIGDLRDYINLPDKSNRGAGRALPKGAPCLRLEHVSYQYPGAEVCALEDIDIEIAAGERLAIVGVNGAGKSTLVNLLCGLFKPTRGTVRMNGEDIAGFNRNEYFTLFSAVFQKIKLLPNDIARNVSQQTKEETNYARVEECLRLAGLWEKVSALPQGLHTELVKQVEPTAIDLSGGENQKLALARAIYKQAPVILLDEPTAALDPIAESEMYQRYAELTGGRTSVYISHRLASTRFCDRIILLDGKRVAEVGTHDELMALGGKYAEMFNVQASYYRDNPEGEGEDNE